MKKIFLGIFVFAIISFLVTGILINQKINDSSSGKLEVENNISGEIKNEINKESGNDKEENNNVSQIKEKTIDLNATYNQNDLIVEEEPIYNEIIKSYINYPQIYGLKDKDVEKRINDDIKQKLNNEFEKIYFEKNIKDFRPYMRVNSNFANILSIEINYGYSINGNYNYDTIYLNYKLIDGEKLKFEDLFVQNADLNSIVRRILYRTFTQNEAWNHEVYDIKFDNEKEEWTAMTWSYDDAGNSNEYRDIYIPKFNEYEIYKIMNKFMSSEDKQFSFTPSEITLHIEGSEYRHNIEFIDIAEDVVIYDKYLTEESIFEKDNIGMKNIWTCSVPTNSEDRFLEYGFAAENLFYQISEGYIYVDNGYPFEKTINTLKDQMLAESRNIIEEYKKIATNNPDKFYILSLNHEINTEKDINIVPTILSETNGYTSIQNKDKVMEDLKDSYRYRNVDFYGSGMGLYLESNSYNESYLKLDKIEGKTHKIIYDARNLKEITSVEELFKDDVDCMNILNVKLKDELKVNWNYKDYGDERIADLIAHAYYDADTYGITANFPNEEYGVTISYNILGRDLLNIYDLNPIFVMPTNIRLIDSSEIENLSLEDLNIAYNEIFARHGHDFKSKDLKEYFDKLSWYNAIQNKAVSLEELSDIERKNIDTIKGMLEQKKNN